MEKRTENISLFLNYEIYVYSLYNKLVFLLVLLPFSKKKPVLIVLLSIEEFIT